MIKNQDSSLRPRKGRQCHDFITRCVWSGDSCPLPLFALPLHHDVSPRLEVPTQNSKFHTNETSPFLEGIWTTRFQTSYLSFPLGFCVTYLGSLCWFCRLREALHSSRTTSWLSWKLCIPLANIGFPPRLSSLSAPTVIIRIPPAPCEILGRWWSPISLHLVNKLYQQILNEWEFGRRGITWRSTLGPSILLAMRRAICPSEMSNQTHCCQDCMFCIGCRRIIKHRWGNGYCSTHIYTPSLGSTTLER